VYRALKTEVVQLSLPHGEHKIKYKEKLKTKKPMSIETGPRPVPYDEVLKVSK